MGIWAGIDIAKEVHWATAVDDRGQVVLDRRVNNDPAELAELAEQLGELDGELVVGLDVVAAVLGARYARTSAMNASRSARVAASRVVGRKVARSRSSMHRARSGRSRRKASAWRRPCR